MNLHDFQSLPTADIADIVRTAGQKVCGFPFNGTRRWFMLEHENPANDAPEVYVNAITNRLLEIIRLQFEHGIDTILLPLLSPYIFDSRGSEYTNSMVNALSTLTDNPNYKDFYKIYGVKVRFYGDYEKYLANSPNSDLIQKFTDLAEETADHQQHRLFWGVCAHDATETAISLSIQYFQQYGKVPTKQDLIQMYYGEQVPPVNIFISASKLRSFDIPLISSGREDLYFTVAPSPYLTEVQFRNILFDHLYARQKDHAKYDEMESGDWLALREFYQANIGNTLGVGKKLKNWGLWVPTPQVNALEGVENAY